MKSRGIDPTGSKNGNAHLRGSMSVAEGVDVGPVTTAAAEIVILNRTGESVWCVQVAPNGAEEWGIESSDSGISDGGEQRWHVPAGSYQLRAETASGQAVTHFGLRLKEGQSAVWTLALG